METSTSTSWQAWKSQNIGPMYTIALSGFAISLFLPSDRYNGLFIGLLCLTWLLEGEFAQKFAMLAKRPFVLLWMAFIGLNIIGILYSDNMRQAVHSLEYRVGLFIFPVILGTIRMPLQRAQRLIYIFAIACVVAMLYCLLARLYHYFAIKPQKEMFFNQLLIDPIYKQATYVGIYINFALMSFVYLLHKNFDFKIPKKFVYAMMAFLGLIIILLASRMSILLLAAFGGVYILGTLFVRKKYWQGGLVIIAGIGLIAISPIVFPQTYNRFASVTNLEFTFDNDKGNNHFNMAADDARWNDLTLRLAIWSLAYQVWEENKWFGTGTGDLMLDMERKYDEVNFMYAKKYGLSVHSQYLQTAAVSGFFGLIVLIAVLIYPIRKAVQKKEYFYLVFIAYMMLSFVTEEVLNRNQGIVWFAFFNSLIWLHIVNAEEPEKVV